MSNGPKPCTCHPDDKPPQPCQHKYALTDCRIAALEAQVAALTGALRVYADGCDAGDTTPCGYEGNMCCSTARAALAALPKGGT